jgi:hypothetical protein
LLNENQVKTAQKLAGHMVAASILLDVVCTAWTLLGLFIKNGYAYVLLFSNLHVHEPLARVESNVMIDTTVEPARCADKDVAILCIVNLTERTSWTSTVLEVREVA